MARTGIVYNDVKAAAYKLLTQGFSPSVQKIREVLGTGSNTTIAEHLRVWREEYAKKEIHHLPANMPQELVSAIEILWQTAMEQAENQLTEVKKSLDSQKERFNQDKALTQKRIDDLNLHNQSLSGKIEKLSTINADLKTELTLAHERLTKSTEEIIELKAQFESKLHRAYDEKENSVENCRKLEDEVKRLQQQINDQSESHQSHIASERSLQEESEKRWLNLIDQSRQESKIQLKKYNDLKKIGAETKAKLDKSIEILKENLRESDIQSRMLKDNNEHLKETHAKLNDDYQILAKENRELNSLLRSVYLNKDTEAV